MRYRNIHDAAVTDGMTFEIPPGEISDGPDGLISPWLVPVDDETAEAPAETSTPSEAPTEIPAESTDPAPAKKTVKKAAAQQSEAPAAASDAAPSEE